MRGDEMPSGKAQSGTWYWCVTGLAAHLQVSEMWLYKKVREGKVPGAVRFGKHIRIKRDVFAKAIKEQGGIC
tara:strand:+ start:8854 stop:9069 length:216 start_codon:yes stop_codon:yes gene_type:complete